MMAYTTESNIINAIGRITLTQLTDDNKTGEVDSEVVTFVIGEAQNEIDSFVRGRYPAEMLDADVPSEITKICTDISIYYLFKRRLQLTMPDTVKDDYKMSMKRLMKIQEGKITPYQQEDEPVTLKTNKTACSKTFNSTVWGKY